MADSLVLEYVREKVPEFQKVDDGTLAEYLFDRQPDLLKKDPRLYEQVRASRSERMPSMQGATSLGVIEPTAPEAEPIGAPQQRDVVPGTDVPLIPLGTGRPPTTPEEIEATKEMLGGQVEKQRRFGKFIPTFSEEDMNIINTFAPNWMKVSAGTLQTVAHTANFFTSPEGAPLLLIGGLPVGIQRAAAGAFALHMASQMPAIYDQVLEEVAKPEGERNLVKISELVSAGGINAFMVTMAGKHALLGKVGPNLSLGKPRGLPNIDEAAIKSLAPRTAEALAETPKPTPEPTRSITPETEKALAETPRPMAREEAERIVAEHEARTKELGTFISTSQSAQHKLIEAEATGRPPEFTPEEQVIVDEMIKRGVDSPEDFGPPGNTYEQTKQYKEALKVLGRGGLESLALPKLGATEAEKAQFLKSEQTLTKGPTDAIQEQVPVAEMLRPSEAQPEQRVEVPRVGKEKPELQKPAEEAPKEVAAETDQTPKGMGAAVPSEFLPPEGEPLGIKNEIIEGRRTARGALLTPNPTVLATKDVLASVKERIDREPDWQDNLIDELEQRPRALTPEETVALDHRYVELENRYDKLAKEIADYRALEEPERVMDLERQLDQVSDQLNTFGEMTRKVGTESGRSLRYRQVMLDRDMTLAQMEMRIRAKRGGEPLTGEERTKLQELHKQLQETAAKAEAAETASRERIAKLEAEKAVAEAKAQMPKIDKRILDYAESLVTKMESAGDAALARLKARTTTFGTSVIPDPTILSDVAIWGASRIARMGLDLAKFTDLLVKEFSEKSRPFAQQLWDAANKILEDNLKSAPVEVKRFVTKAAPQEQIDTAIANIEAKVNKGELDALSTEIQKLVRGMVSRDPKITMDELWKGVHTELQKFMPEITPLESLDAISGRGKFTLPKQDATSRTVRDLKTQARIVGHQLDVIMNRPLPRTGPQRDPMSNLGRQALQKLNDLMRRYGIKTSNPASTLKSVLDARKTYYRNQIADLDAQIKAKSKFVKEKTPPPTDPELETLKARRDELKKQFDETFPKQELTDAQRAEREVSNLDKQIAEVERQLKEGDIFPSSKKPKPTSPEIKARQAKLDALKSERQYLRESLLPEQPLPEQRALRALQARLERNTADLLDRMARGDVEKRTRKPPPELDAAALRAHAENRVVKQQFQEWLNREKFKRMPALQKVVYRLLKTFRTPRSLITSYDLSAVLRQGGFISVGHPIRAAKSIVPMLKALANERNAAAVMEEIGRRENAPHYARSKLELPSLDKLEVLGREEHYQPSYAEEIPLIGRGVRASERAYVTFLNKLRADSFDAMANFLGRWKELTQKDYDAIANYVNVATGRGSMGSKAAAAAHAANIFFSPRLVASRFQLLLGQPFYRGTLGSRLLIAKEYAHTLIGLLVIYQLGKLAGAMVETDTNSSDASKLRFGNTRVDPMMGLAQSTTLLSRLATGETKTIKGNVKPIRGNVPYGSQTSVDVMAHFLRTKLAPVPGAAVNIIQGKNVIGEKVTPLTIARDLTIPISYQDILSIMEEQGVARGTAIEMLNLLGMSVQHFEESPNNYAPNTTPR